MIGDRRVVAIIPARGGSKSIKHKNLSLVNGKSLIQRSVECAKSSLYIDRIIVSTDDEMIAEESRISGAEVYLRDEAMATDTSLVADTVRSLILQLRGEGERAEYMCLLEPTTPLRKSKDVDKCISYLDDEQFDSVATVREAELNPNRAWRLKDGILEPFIDIVDPWAPRQLLPSAYQLSGTAYVFNADKFSKKLDASFLFGKHGCIQVERVTSIDIDHQIDLMLINQICKYYDIE
jgi:N-acylneuraminate cytidylyltransferase